MNSCKIFKNILVTSDVDKVKCVNDACDERQLNVTLPGFFSYSLTGVGGPANIENSGMRSYQVCSPSSITSSVEIIMIQTATLGDLHIRFKVPMYQNTDINSPAVSSLLIYKNDC